MIHGTYEQRSRARSLMKYAGVDVDNPRIVDAIKTLSKQGKNNGQIMRIVGMPQEVVDKYAREAREKK